MLLPSCSRGAAVGHHFPADSLDFDVVVPFGRLAGHKGLNTAQLAGVSSLRERDALFPLLKYVFLVVKLTTLY